MSRGRSERSVGELKRVVSSWSSVGSISKFRFRGGVMVYVFVEEVGFFGGREVMGSLPVKCLRRVKSSSSLFEKRNGWLVTAFFGVKRNSL